MIPVLSTIPRSGTHYLKNLISAALGVPPLEKDLVGAPDDLRVALSVAPGSQLIYGHFRFSLHAEILDKQIAPDLRMVVLTRHPLDRQISQLAFEKALCGRLPDPEQTPQQLAHDLFLGQWDGKPWKDGWVVEDFAARANFLFRDHVTDWLDNRDCHLIKFEESDIEAVEVLTKCLAFFRVIRPHEEIVEITKRDQFRDIERWSLAGTGRSRVALSKGR